MANQFSGDPHCIALYRFESGALTTDSKGTNTLTNSGGVSADAADFKEGAASGRWERSDGNDSMTCTDANLSASHPLKSSCATKVTTICFWMKKDEDPAQFAYLFSKANWSTDVSIFCDNNSATEKLRVAVGSGDGSAVEWCYLDEETPVGVWCFIVVWVWQDGADLRINIRQWRTDTAAWGTKGEAVGTGVTWHLNSEDFIIGEGDPDAHSGVDWGYDGWLDEFVVFDDLLSDDEADEIRQGIYLPLPGQPINPVPANGAVNVAATTNLDWDTGGFTDTYDVYLGTAPGALVLVSDDQVGTSYTPVADLDVPQTYYWRVDATNTQGTTTGTVWSFTTGAPVDVAPFFLAFPSRFPLSETLTGNTGILKGADGSEQRIARRVPLVQSFTYSLLCRTEVESMELVNLLHNSLKESHSIPIWAEAERRTGPLAAGALAIAIDTRYSDYRVDGNAVVYSDPEHAEVVETSAIADDGLTLAAGLVNDYSAPQWVMPCRTGYIVAAAVRERYDRGASLVDVVYEVTDNIEITGYVAALTYDGYEVLTEAGRFTGAAFREQHDGDITIIDAGIGSAKVISISDFNVTSQDHGWINDSKAKAWSFRQWLHSVVARQKAFLVPTYRPNFVLSRPCGAADTIIYVAKRGFYQHAGGANTLRNYLAFRPVGATIIPRKITSISDATATEERIDLNAAPGSAFDAGAELCWVDRCRLASDQVRLEWYRRGRNVCETQLVRVQQ